jgi:hypothetical protein
MLYEDETANRMVEAITLFEAHCNNKFFEHIDMILFLNKRDLFESKIARKAIETVPDVSITAESLHGCNVHTD